MLKARVRTFYRITDEYEQTRFPKNEVPRISTKHCIPKISKTAKETKKPAKPKPAAEPENLPLRLELRKLKWSRSKCCWPSGDPKLSGFTFCGDAVVPGKPYCLKHCEEAYTTSRDSR